KASHSKRFEHWFPPFFGDRFPLGKVDYMYAGIWRPLRRFTRQSILPSAGVRASTILRRAMSALGQKRTCAVQKGMSALPPIATGKADIPKRSYPLYLRKRTCAVH